MTISAVRVTANTLFNRLINSNLQVPHTFHNLDFDKSLHANIEEIESPEIFSMVLTESGGNWKLESSSTRGIRDN